MRIGNTFKKCSDHINRRLRVRLWSQKILMFFLSYYFLLCFPNLEICFPNLSLSLGLPLYILICVGNQINFCVKYFDLAFLFLCPANTSCGLPLKMLRKTPIYTCGTYLVMLVPPPGGSGSSATRSLFGGTSGLSSLKSKWILPVALSSIYLKLWNLRLSY